VRLLEDLGCESVWAVEHVVVPSKYASVYPYGPPVASFGDKSAAAVASFGDKSAAAVASFGDRSAAAVASFGDRSAATSVMSLGPDDDVPDPLHWLTFAAAHTSVLKLGVAMLILPLHNPVGLAKRLSTIDRLSGGRLLAGVGVGWLREEYDAVGVPFEARGRRADEYLLAMRALWRDKPSTFDGEFVSFRDVHSMPRPVRQSGVPIVVGGHSPAAARRAARYGDGFYPLGVDAAGLASLLDVLRAECETIGRDPAEIAVTARAPRTAAETSELAALGVSRVVIRVDADDLAGTEKRVLRHRKEIGS
jgi:probable F420-dependent oxidoreductase